ncbi:GNAT family N-acetyltransferase [Methylocystis sp. JR02]|uniref:GNAT family N-acetyltransferase n=1 Tax=Methylocystis sp. JR02 TaxID=3046284 RepID=UPI0024BBC912|nr:GNAT family N-acetyltransferase [Methylocystis sp. JR02]MDJ0448071.1 GNAT family N-acetyltransferase [Methylocystis sp. JR02]
MTRFYSTALGARDRRGFSSGNARIDRYFANGLGQDVRRNYAACYVLVERSDEKIVGFYTLSSSGVPLLEVPPDLAGKLPRYPTVPAVLIGWLARDKAYAGEGVGGLLLFDAFARICASPIGAHAIIVDAIDDAAAAFYRKYLFKPFANKPDSLFLPLTTARRLIEADQ